MSSSKDTRVQPITIGPGNALAMTGIAWRWWRDHASELGLEIIRLGAKPVIRAADAIAVLEREAARRTPAERETSELAAMARAVGVEVLP